MHQGVVNGLRPFSSKPDGCDKDVADMLEKCWLPKPEDRPSPKELCEMMHTMLGLDSIQNPRSDKDNVTFVPLSLPDDDSLGAITIIAISDTQARSNFQIKCRRRHTLDQVHAIVANYVKKTPSQIVLYSGGKKLQGSDTIQNHLVTSLSAVQLIYIS